MKYAAILLALALSACALPTFEPPQPGTSTPRQTQTARPSDLEVSVPRNRSDRRAERGEAAAECAQYGRVEQRRGGNGDYACVRPGEAAPREIWE